MECPYCNTENRDGVRYCSNCGNFIGAASTTMPASKPVGADSVVPSSRSLAPGSRLQGGRYVIKKILGQGGMGAALLATDIRLDSKPVVIKELISDNVDPTKSQEDVRNFKREVATLAHIDHPLVPNVTDHFQEGPRYFMVQEYIEGENLEDRLERTNQPFKEREALICASEVLDILDYLAQQTPPIVHRDIKPANIIIGAKDRRAHLVDFGIARAEAAKNTKRKQTAALGTPGYAPPEQYQGNADPRSDLYALAATLHHMLTNRDPRNHPPFNYPPVRALNPQLSPEIERVLNRALLNDINQRYQSAAAMKQDIDSILRQRFGMAGNIDSYTLGTSGPIGSVSAGANSITSSGTNYPQYGTTGQSTTVPASTPMTPVQPLQTLQPHTAVSQGTQSRPQSPYLPSHPGQQGPPSQPRRRNRTGLVVLLILLLLALISASAFAALHYLRPASSTGIGASRIGNEYIGISDGTVAFDTSRDDGSLKTQAAQALKGNSNDTNPAISFLNQAIGQDPSDAEARIYQEDLRVLNSGSPYVTIVVATMLSGDAGSVGEGRDDLQGAYIAQKEFNDGSKLHAGVQVRLLIASSGSKTAYVAQVVQQITQLAQSDKTFVGVMGWPYSSRSVAAIKTLSSASIPMVSSVASSDQLSNASHYFFRVVPPNKAQGVNGAKYAEQNLHARRVALFYDPSDPYSQSLAQDFSQQFETIDKNTVVARETYTVGQPATLPSSLQDALRKEPDLIYFSGYANDVSTLLTNLPAGNLPVMGGDALYELAGYTSSGRSGFTHLRFTAFAYPDEWDILGYTASKPAFFSEYTAAYNANGQYPPGKYGFTRTSNSVILAYDATVALLKGCDSALSNGGKTSITPQELQQGLKTINGARSFQGVSGQISFGPDGDPINKAMVILYVDADGHIHMEPSALGQFLK